MPYRAALLIFFVALASSIPGVAAADNYQAMLDLSNEAAQSVADEQFQIGAVQFRQAYEHYPDPVLLNNEMIAWYRSGDCRNALTPARAFLELDSEERDDIDAEERQNVRTVMVECHLDLADEALANDNITLASYHLETLATLELDDESQDQFDALRDDIDQHPTDEQIDVASPADASSNHLGWAQIASGIAAAGLGVTLHGVALSRQSHLEELSETDASRFEQRRSDWSGFQNTTRWAVPGLYVVGAAAIGSGTYFLLQDSSSSESGDLSLSPSISEEQTGLTLSGRF